MKLPNYLKKAHKASVRAGWRWEERTNHVTVRNSDGQFVVCVSTTAYEGTLTRKIQGKLRKAGCPGV